MPGKLPGRPTIGGNGIDIPVAVALAPKGDPFAIRRINWIGVCLDVRGKRHGAASLGGRDPNITTVNEGKVLSIRAQGGHACAYNRLLSWWRELGGNLKSCPKDPGQDKWQSILNLHGYD